MPLKVPSPLSYTSAEEFLKEFYSVNKAKSRKFSYRSFAMMMKWPTSYLADVIQGRRVLTIQRAIQFADRFKFNSVKKEHLVKLAVFGKGAVDTDRAASQLSPNSLLKTVTAESDIRLQNDVEWVARLLLWKRRNLSAQEISSTFDLPTMTEERLNLALQSIAERGIFTWNSAGELQHYDAAKTLQDFDHSDTKGDVPHSGLELHRDGAENLIAFVQSPKRPALYNTRFVYIPRGEFMPVAMKMLELRNWIDDLSRQHLNEAGASDKTCYIMQLDLNLFPIAKP